MMKKFGKALLGAAAAVTLVLGLVPVVPVKAAGVASFKQQIKVVDKTDDSHSAKVTVPGLKITYKLTPIVGTANLPANDTRYAQTLDSFPDGTLKDTTKVITADVSIASAQSDKNGLIEKTVAATDLFATGTTFGATSKVYRYQLEIAGVFAQTGTSTWSDNLLDSKDVTYLFPESTTKLLDISVGTDFKTIVGMAFWDAAGAEKQDGYLADNSDEIDYNVSDIKVSSDYIGQNWNNLEKGFQYTVTLTNLPSYLTQTAITDALDDQGLSWKVDTTATTDLSAGKFVIAGPLNRDSEIIFSGMPKDVKYKASLDFNKLETAKVNGVATDLREQYGSAIYFGAPATRVSGITDMKSFAASDMAKEYEYQAYKKGSDSDARATSEATTVLTADGNSARFVIFDPDQLIIVGIIRRNGPAVLMVAVAAAIMAALIASKKRQAADVRYDFR